MSFSSISWQTRVSHCSARSVRAWSGHARLQVFDSILGGAQLHPKLMRHVHSAFALLVRQIGCLLESCNNRLSKLIQRITFIGSQFFLACRLHDLLGTSGARSLMSPPRQVTSPVKHYGSPRLPIRSFRNWKRKAPTTSGRSHPAANRSIRVEDSQAPS